MTDPKVEAARIAVERARAQMIDTAKVLQRRLEPAKLTRDAWQTVKDKGAYLAEDAVDAVRSRPYAAGGVVAAVTMFLAREPIKDAVVSVYDAMTSKKKEPGAKAAALKRQASAKPAGGTARRQARPAPRAVRKKTEKT